MEPSVKKFEVADPIVVPTPKSGSKAKGWKEKL